MTFDRDDYQAWREKRFEFIVNYYGEDFLKGKTVLEVGAGYGHLGNRFHEIGAIVTSVDGREENVEGIRSRFPHLNSSVCDLETTFPEGNFDVCLHTGVLYHVDNSIQSLYNACAVCDHLILETETIDSSDPYLTQSILENTLPPDSAVSGRGTRLTAAHVERLLRKWNRTFVRCDAPALNSGIHLYDWEVLESNDYGPQFRRFWFICRS